MKSFFNKNDVVEMKARVEQLSFDTPALWGKFNVNEMLCHLQDQMSYALGLKDEDKTLLKGPPMFIRNMIRLYMPFPKGKIQTVPLMLETKPSSWENDKTTTLALMDRFPESTAKEAWPQHPFFGQLDGEAWAKLVWRHTHHHLNQFGV